MVCGAERHKCKKVHLRFFFLKKLIDEKWSRSRPSLPPPPLMKTLHPSPPPLMKTLHPSSTHPKCENYNKANSLSLSNFFTSADLLTEKGLIFDHAQDHQEIGKEEMSKDIGTTLHVHLQGTDDSSPTHHHTHPPENHRNHPLLTDERHGKRGGLQSPSKIIVLVSQT